MKDVSRSTKDIEYDSVEDIPEDILIHIARHGKGYYKANALYLIAKRNDNLDIFEEELGLEPSEYRDIDEEEEKGNEDPGDSSEQLTLTEAKNQDKRTSGTT